MIITLWSTLQLWMLQCQRHWSIHSWRVGFFWCFTTVAIRLVVVYSGFKVCTLLRGTHRCYYGIWVQHNEYYVALLAEATNTLTPSCAETEIPCRINVSTMAADALTPCINRSSATMVLMVQDKWALSSVRNDFNYLHYLSVEKLSVFQTKLFSQSPRNAQKISLRI